MKKQFIKLALVFSIIILLTDCKKFGKDYETYFYTDVENSEGPLILFVDGKSKGELPYLKTSVSASNDTLLTNALHITLKSGKYKIEAKDNQGNLKCKGTLKFRTGFLGSSNTMGGQATAASGKVIVTKITN